jgi:chromosomal replication initiation ATPase DnaA
MTPTFNIYKAAVQYQQPKVTNDNLIIIKIKEIIRETLNISWPQINKHTRQRDIMFARQLFQYLCHRFTLYTYKAIGQLTEHIYDHSTVIHSKDTIENVLWLKDRSDKFRKVESAILRLTAYTGKKIL